MPRRLLGGTVRRGLACHLLQEAVCDLRAKSSILIDGVLRLCVGKDTRQTDRCSHLVDVLQTPPGKRRDSKRHDRPLLASPCLRIPDPDVTVWPSKRDPAVELGDLAYAGARYRALDPARERSLGIDNPVPAALALQSAATGPRLPTAPRSPWNPSLAAAWRRRSARNIKPRNKADNTRRRAERSSFGSRSQRLVIRARPPAGNVRHGCEVMGHRRAPCCCRTRFAPEPCPMPG